ncbi:MAG: hypothetical protein RLO52_30235 [Sandaracinaceae bacterium]
MPRTRKLKTPTPKSLAATVLRALRRIEKDPAFAGWSAGLPMQDGDSVVFNNSFLFRGGSKTSKSPHYLVAPVGRTGKLAAPLSILEPSKAQNVDFRYIPKRQASPALVPLDDAIRDQRTRLGTIVFTLISTVVEDRRLQLPFAQEPFETITLDPNGSEDVVLKGTEVVLRNTEDEAALWAAMGAKCSAIGVSPGDKMKSAFAKALDALETQASASLRLPPTNARTKTGVTDNILRALRAQKRLYARSLKRYQAARTDDSRRTHFNEVLRVAYSFSREAATLLDLIVSICDLKPLVLWCTIDRHFALSEALRALPWTRSKNKPTMANYVNAIGDSRNRAFHSVFPFEKALHFVLPDGALDGAELRLFSEFGSKSHANELTYNDKELVEVLTKFTRTRMRPTPDSFWVKNEAVMDAMVALFAATNDLLKELHVK